MRRRRRYSPCCADGAAGHSQGAQVVDATGEVARVLGDRSVGDSQVPRLLMPPGAPTLSLTVLPVRVASAPLPFARPPAPTPTLSSLTTSELLLR